MKKVVETRITLITNIEDLKKIIISHVKTVHDATINSVSVSGEDIIFDCIKREMNDSSTNIIIPDDFNLIWSEKKQRIKENKQREKSLFAYGELKNTIFNTIKGNYANCSIDKILAEIHKIDSNYSKSKLHSTIDKYKEIVQLENGNFIYREIN